jgi:colicin import membrane protein
MSAKVDSSCPYDEAGRRSVENAVLRAQPLPYQGFESVFQRDLTFTFRPQ